MKKSPRPGWYPDPSGAKEQRYYDGTKWTENRAPKKKISVLKILLGTSAVLFIVWFLIGFFGVGEAKAEEYYKYCEIAHIYGVTPIYAGSRLWAIQSKAYKDTYWVTKHDVDKFLSESSRKFSYRSESNQVFSHRMLIATTDRLGNNAERAINNQEKPVTFFGLTKLEQSQVNWPASISDLVAPPWLPKEPRDYQIEAVNAVIDGFSRSDRGQMIMACGTGKTLTSLFVKEKLAADRTLVLAPSLSLLSQTLTEWTANTTVDFEYLPVCSDETVVDSIVMSANDLGDVTTVPAEIADFLREPGPRVVFATYQSSPQITEAFKLGGVDPFDLVVADEAHRTASRIPTAFTTVLDNKNIPAKRRLFMTATPRFIPGAVIAEVTALGREVASMDNEAKYGPVFHRLPFSEAIERELLTDYQVVVIGVDDVMCRELADKARWVQSNDLGNTDGRTLAAQIGLAKAMSRYDMRRAISFHSRVASARRFSHSLAEVVSWMPADVRPTGQVWASYVSGEMTAKHRNVRLRELGTIDTDHRGLLSNARCLTEGVDVPTLDGVAFIDPKRSENDIVQAVGRAIRLAPDKTVGTIVIPVFMDSSEDHEAILDDSTFKAVWWVVKALRMHDEELAEQLDSLRLGLGHRGAGQPRLPEKIHLDLPAHINPDFARAFDVRLVSSVTAPWLEWLGRLQKHYETTGTVRVVKDHRTPEGHPLGAWVSEQRVLRNRGKLSAERIEILENIGDWTWNTLDTKFEQFVDELRKYFQDNGTIRNFPEGHSLFSRVNNYRTRYKGKGKPLSAERIEILESIGDWTWNARDASWEQFIDDLRKYFQDNGTVRGLPKGSALLRKATTQRMLYRKNQLPAERIETLEGIGDWTWEPYDAWWEQFVADLRKCFADNGTVRTFPEGHPLQDKVIAYRTKKNSLSAERIETLEGIGDWTWNTRDAKWEEFIDDLRKYFEDNGTVRTFPEGHPLLRKSSKQRVLYKKDKLSVERIETLESIGDWSWRPHNALFERFVDDLRKYFADNGTVRSFPRGHSLVSGVGRQRQAYKQDKLSAERIAILEGIGDWTWDTRN